MAKISNQTAYPQQNPVALTDYLIGTSASGLATKTFSVQSLADIIDGQVTLQEVLDAGNTATQDINLTGDITLADATSDLIMSGGKIASVVGQNIMVEPATGRAFNSVATDLNFQVSNDITLNASGDFDILGVTTSRVSATAGLNIDSKQLHLKSDSSVGSKIQVGGPLATERPEAVNVQGVNSVKLFTDAVSIEVNQSVGNIITGKLNIVDELSLNGDSGTAGQFLTSNGIGVDPSWTTAASPVPDLTENNIFAGTTLNKAQATDLIFVDLDAVTPAAYNIKIGKNSGSNFLLQGDYGTNCKWSAGTDNLAFGQEVLSNGNPGSNNTAFGIQALSLSLSSSNDNTAVGRYALRDVTGSERNTAVGSSAGLAAGLGDDNTLVGYQAMYNSGNVLAINNVAIGSKAFLGSQYHKHSVVVGFEAAAAASIGESVVAIGRQALGSGNPSSVVAVGDRAGQSQAGTLSTLVGHSAGRLTEAGSNTLIGANTLTYNVTDSQATAIGALAKSGIDGAAIGYQAFAQRECVALGANADAQEKINESPMVAFSAAISVALEADYVFSTNTAAVAAGLSPGDIYVVTHDVNQPAQLAIVY